VVEFGYEGDFVAYFLHTVAKIATVDTHALQPPSSARRTMFSGSKYMGLGAKAEAAECSMPWSTGRMDRYPVPASLPWLKIAAMFLMTGEERFEVARTRSMKSGPGKASDSLGMVLHLCSRRAAASPPKIAFILSIFIVHPNRSQ
jgi:hypothetical protein